ncbi:MAG: HlyD family efflux transporter periplasmic adaptor subunit [Planctomycetes bacterium]|nr:HlyD family efflux transporter periplasmic adaptor subunit [Planctomycetota bacterium]
MSESATAFPSVRGFLRADGFRRSLWAIGSGVVLLGAWVCWLCFARVPIWEVSTSARLESTAATHRVQPAVAGRVAAMHLTIGSRVRAGDVLVELDAESQRLALAETTSRRRSLTDQIARIDEQTAKEEDVLRRQDEAAPKALDEASARLREAVALQALARETEKRVGELVRVHNTSELEGLKAATELARADASVDEQRIALDRLRLEQASDHSRQAALIDRLRLERSAMQGDVETTASSLKRLEHEIDLRLVRAPVDGVVAEVGSATAGAIVREGDVLAAIVPDGLLRIVAEFRPQSALGRIRTGQHARLRLAGFPSLEYGTIDATVASIASEVRDDLVRVELAVDSAPRSRIPLQHGLPGSLEVEIDRVSPAALILRAAGGAFRTEDAVVHPERQG